MMIFAARFFRADRALMSDDLSSLKDDMNAFILVFSHRYFAVTGADGRYQIGRVPAGRYTLKAWNEGSDRESRQIVVPDDQAVVEADFSLR